MRGSYNVLVGKSERKSPLASPRLRCKYNVRMDIRGIIWDDVEWMHLVQDRDQ
jgi:hypothetical protein